MAGSLDRAKLAELLAAQVAPVIRPIHLPSLDLDAYVRPLDGELKAKIVAYASIPAMRAGKAGKSAADIAADDDDISDAGEHALVAAVRWRLVDEDGNPVCASYAEARGLMRLLDLDDLSALDEAVRPEELVGGVDEGKGSS